MASDTITPPRLTVADSAVPESIWKSVRLGIVTGTPASRDDHGRLWINHSLGRLFEALRVRVPNAKICLPVVPHQPSFNHEFEFPEASVTTLPPLIDTIRSQKFYFQTRSALKAFAATCDVLFVRLPFQLPRAVERLGVPKLLHVVGSPVGVISASTNYRGLVKRVALWFARHSEASMRRMVAEPHTRIATNGAEMWERLHCRRGRVVVSSCLRESEIRPREDLALNDPPRLLFVGYLRPEKGALVLLEAFERLRANRPLKLTLVGGGDRPSAAEAAIIERFDRSPYREDIERVGMVPFGETLFELFRSHDIFVAPSFSEGTPRTVVEARAFGCAVVASRVGGIPTSIRHGHDGLLVEPGDTEGLASAIASLLDDDGLRVPMIERGMASAREMSLENFSDQLVDELRQVAIDSGRLPAYLPEALARNSGSA